MQRLRNKMGALSLQEIGNGANNENRGVVFDFRSLMDNGNQEVHILPNPHIG